MNAGNKITFESFTERVARRANISDTEADTYLHQLGSTAVDALEDGDEVQLHHFGRFQTTHVDARAGHNPGTGETLTVPEHTRVDFQPYKALLLAVNSPFRHLRTRMIPEKKSGTQSSVALWLLLMLALAGFILIGILLYKWMSEPNTKPGALTAAPVEAPAAIAPGQPAIEPPLTVSKAETDTATATEAAPATDTGRDIETVTATDRPIEPAVENATIVAAPGDTLWGISQSQWGDTTWWPLIYAENRANLAARNPDLIETGISLRIPVLAGSIDDPTDADLRQKANAYRMVAGDYKRLGHARAAEYRRFVSREFDGR